MWGVPPPPPPEPQLQSLTSLPLPFLLSLLPVALNSQGARRGLRRRQPQFLPLAACHQLFLQDGELALVLTPLAHHLSPRAEPGASLMFI